MKKKTRKKNPERITQAWLEKRVGLINSMMGNPETAYTKTASGLKQNAGHLYIDSAYGGVGLERMSTSGADTVSGGHVPKRELSNFMDGFIAALRLIDRQKRGLNPARKKTVRKKTTRKKNSVGAVKPKGFIIVTFIRVYNSLGYALDSNGARMDFRKGNAKVWKTKSGADKAAQTVANGWGESVAVFPVNTSERQILSLIGKQKVK